MLEEFIDFCAETFPSISPYKIESLKNAVEQFKQNGHFFECCLPTPLGYYAQGDIFTDLPFSFVDSKGDYNIIKRHGILLSNTCDASRNDTLIFAALQPIELRKDSPQMRNDLKNNKLTQFMYIPREELKDKAIDFGLINSFPRELIVNGCSANKTKKICSLNDYGFYILLTKLTIFFARRQDEETERDRRIGIHM